MTLPRRLGAALARVEPRHWAGLAASVLLHLLVALGWRPSPPPEPPVISFEIDLEPPTATSAPPVHLAATPTPARKPAPKAKAKSAKPDTAREPHTLDAEWRGERGPIAHLPDVALPDAQALGVTAAALPRAVYQRASTAATSTTGDEVAAMAVAAAGAIVRETTVATQPTPAGETPAKPAQAAKPAARGAPPSDTPARAEAGIAGEPSGDALAATPVAPEADLSASAAVATAALAGAVSGGQTANPDAALTPADGPARAREASLAATPVADARRQPTVETGGARVATGDDAARTHAGAPSAQSGLVAGRAEDAPAATLKAAGGTALAMPAATATGLLAGQTDARQMGNGSLSASANASGMTGAATARAANDGLPPSAPTAGGPPSAHTALIGDVTSGAPLAPAQTRMAGNGAVPSARAGTAGARIEATGPTLARVGVRAAPVDARGETRRGGVSTPSSGASLATGGGLDAAPPGSLHAVDGGARAGFPTSRSTASATSAGAGASLTLAPGEPGGSPDTAVAMPALLATPNASSGRRTSATTNARALASGGADGLPRTLSDATAAGGGDRSAGTATSGSGARLSGNIEGAQHASGVVEAPVVLRATHAVTVQVMRPDSEIERLDVLAPASFCPLPGFFPDNRPVAGTRTDADDSLPGYGDNNPNFHYPLRAWAFSQEGRVTLRVEVLHDGRPGQILLKHSSGSGILDQDAREQIARWRFVPARRSGQTVTAWIDVPVVYRLREGR